MAKTANLNVQSFFTTTLSSAVNDGTETTIYLNSVPTPDEGFLVIDYDNATKREIIFYNAKGANYVTCPSAAEGRGCDATSAQAHASGADVRMVMTKGYIDAIKDGSIFNDAAIPTSKLADNSLQWFAPAATLSYATADSPTFTATLAGDYTEKIPVGSRVKLQQAQAISNYWSFDTNSADSKGSATMADIGTPTYTSGKFSNALTLNGTNQALSITDAAAFKPTGDFTLGCWFKTSATGAVRTLFQSYSDNSNANGLRLSITAANVLSLYVGNNAADPTSSVVGSTTVTDGNFHHLVLTTRNNWTQIYLDGKLEVSGYTVTPTYHATNYVRIGCSNSTGSNAEWFNGQIDDLFLINGYALDEQTIKAKYDAGTAQGTANITITKKFLVTDSSYSAPNTTITMYGGTDYALANSTISNVYYSTQKAPYGFPLNKDKWTVRYWDNTDCYKSSPTASTYYGTTNAWTAGNSLTISVPIGEWNIGYTAPLYVSDASAGNYVLTSALTRSGSAATETDTTAVTIIYVGAGTTGATVNSQSKHIKHSAKTSWYLLATAVTSGTDKVGFYGNINLYAVSTLL